jgi:hypothetical protein
MLFEPSNSWNCGHRSGHRWPVAAPRGPTTWQIYGSAHLVYDCPFRATPQAAHARQLRWYTQQGSNLQPPVPKLGPQQTFSWPLAATRGHLREPRAVERSLAANEGQRRSPLLALTCHHTSASTSAHCARMPVPTIEVEGMSRRLSPWSEVMTFEQIRILGRTLPFPVESQENPEPT